MKSVGTESVSSRMMSLVKTISNYDSYNHYTLQKIDQDLDHVNSMLKDQPDEESLLDHKKNFERLRRIFEKNLKIPGRSKQKREHSPPKTERDKINGKIDEEVVFFLTENNLKQETFVNYLEQKLEMFQEQSETVEMKVEVVKFSDEYLRFLERKANKLNASMQLPSSTDANDESTQNLTITEKPSRKQGLMSRTGGFMSRSLIARNKSQSLCKNDSDVGDDLLRLKEGNVMSSTISIKPRKLLPDKIPFLPFPLHAGLPLVQNNGCLGKLAPKLTPLPKKTDGRWGLAVKLTLKKGSSCEMNASSQLEDDASTPEHAEYPNHRDSFVEILDKPVKVRLSKTNSSSPQNGKADSPMVGTGNLEWEKKALVYTSPVKKLNEIHHGQDSSIYAVMLQDETGRIVALKEYLNLKQKQVDVEMVTEILMQDFAMLSGLNHPNLLKYIAIYKCSQQQKYSSASTLGVLMELMDGGSLEDYMAKGGYVRNIGFNKKIARQVLQGLLYLHENKIIHRDLKPSNILFSSDNERCCLSDYGIPARLHDSFSLSQTNRSNVNYTAPEILMNEALSAKADIWSIGCIIYQLFLGERPYQGLNWTTILLRMRQEATPLESITPEQRKILDDNEFLEDFLRKCFDRDKSKRATAQSLLTHPFLAEN